MFFVFALCKAWAFSKHNKSTSLTNIKVVDWPLDNYGGDRIFPLTLSQLETVPTDFGIEGIDWVLILLLIPVQNVTCDNSQEVWITITGNYGPEVAVRVHVCAYISCMVLLF